MSITLTYDDQLARVRVALNDIGVRNSNIYFETDASGWQAFGGALSWASDQAHEGTHSLKLTPDGVAVTARAETTPAATGITAGQFYRAEVWVRCAVARNVSPQINWFDAAGTYLSTGNGGAIPVAANTWVQLSVTAVAPASTGRATINISLDGSPLASHVLWIDEARLMFSAVADAAYMTVERLAAGGVRASYVRGASHLPVGERTVDDYEFVPGALTTYRARLFSDVGVQVASESATITPTIDGAWLKSVARPYLNRSVVVQDYTPPRRPSRAGVFDVAGRTMPIVVSDVAGSRRWTLTVLTRTLDDAHALDLLLASGDIVHVQVPPEYDIPAGYVSVGDVDLARLSRPLSDDRRLFTIPLTECAAPGPDVVGSTSTWATLLASYGSWTAVLAEFATWQEVLDYVAAADTVIVP
jgi:hypothetical protein